MTLCDKNQVITVILWGDNCYEIDRNKRFSEERFYLGAEDEKLRQHAIAFENLQITSCNNVKMLQTTDNSTRVCIYTFHMLSAII